MTEGRKESSSHAILVVGVFTLLTVGSWVVFDVYRALTKTTVPKVLQDQIKPLELKINADLVSKLKQRKQFEESYLNSIVPKTSTVKTATTSANRTTPVASPSASLEETTASPSASPGLSL